MSLKANLELLANYNQLMNKNLYQAAAALDANELAKDRGAFFHSIIGTLNHILVGDIIWLKRFADHPLELKSLNYLRALPRPASLDTLLYTEFDALMAERSKIDNIIIDFTQELNDHFINSSLSYHDTKGFPFTQNSGQLVQHLFNHQTHHRGQVSTLLNQVGIDIGVTDLITIIPDEKDKK